MIKVGDIWYECDDVKTIEYIYCVACYYWIAATCVRSVGCIFTHLSTHIDDSEHPWTMSRFTTHISSLVNLTFPFSIYLHAPVWQCLHVPV